ncbi:MAG: hydroxyisourate hydrolase [Kineosporiaceae bacterium]
MTGTTTISTHVLDAVRGRPAAGLGVRLDRREDGAWHERARRVTDADGRVPDLAAQAPTGVYRLTLDTEDHLGPDAFYPEVVVVFRVADGAHHHVPVLLSPYSYTTYRGS